MIKLLEDVLLVLLLVAVVVAHKDASVSSSSTASYDVNLGKIPVHSYVNNMEQLYFEITDTDTEDPITGLNAKFKIYKDIFEASQASPDKLVGEINSVETKPGIYTGEYSIIQVGNYMTIAELYKGTSLLTSMTKTFSVEPNGPSFQFWVFMLLALVLGVLLSTESHKVG